MKRTLYLAVVPVHLVEQMWGLDHLFVGDHIKIKKSGITHTVVRCNKKGVINWNTTGVYTFGELIGKKIMFVK